MGTTYAFTFLLMVAIFLPFCMARDVLLTSGPKLDTGKYLEHCMARDILRTGEKLDTGEYLQNRHFVFIMQEDCNLVLYVADVEGWATNTSGLGTGCYAMLGNTGVLSVYNKSGAILWSSAISSVEGNYVIVLPYDGYLDIYGPQFEPNWSPSTLTDTTRGNDGKGIIYARKIMKSTTAEFLANV